MPEIRAGVFVDLLMESSTIRVEKITLKPGARTGFHAHGVHYTMIACNVGRTVRLDKNGHFEELLNLVPGASWRRSDTFAHDVINVSDEDVVMLKVFDLEGAKAPQQRRPGGRRPKRAQKR